MTNPEPKFKEVLSAALGLATSGFLLAVLESDCLMPEDPENATTGGAQSQDTPAASEAA